MLLMEMAWPDLGTKLSAGNNLILINHGPWTWSIKFCV